MNLYRIEIAQFKIWNVNPGPVELDQVYPWVMLQNVKYPDRYLAVAESGTKLTTVLSKVNSCSMQVCTYAVGSVTMMS